MMIIPNWMESHKIPWFQTTNQDISTLYQFVIYEFPVWMKDTLW